jgi:hypothetical protein
MILSIILLSLSLAISLAVNILLIWYNRQAVRKILFVSDNIGDVMGLVKEYQEHLESLYEMQMFYGDAELASLIDHTKFIVGEIKAFEDIYALTRPEGEETDTYDEENRDEDGPEAEKEA